MWSTLQCVNALPECPKSAYCHPDLVVIPELCASYCNDQGGSRVFEPCYDSDGSTSYAQSQCLCDSGSPNPTCEVPALKVCLSPATSYEACKTQCRGGTLQYSYNNGLSICDCLDCQSLSTSSRYTPQTAKPTSRFPTLPPTSLAPTTSAPIGNIAVNISSTSTEERFFFTFCSIVYCFDLYHLYY